MCPRGLLARHRHQIALPIRIDCHFAACVWRITDSGEIISNSPHTGQFSIGGPRSVLRRRQHELRALELADATMLAKPRSLADPGFYGLPRPLLSSYADSQIQGFE